MGNIPQNSKDTNIPNSARDQESSLQQLSDDLTYNKAFAQMDIALLPPRQEQTYFQLLDLPPELRLLVYGHFFYDILKGLDEPDGDVYRLPSEWPCCEQSAYASLVATCKLVHGEAVPYFEKHFLLGLTMYLDSVYETQELHTSVAHLELAYGGIRFSLRTKCDLACSDYGAQNNQRLSLIARYTDQSPDHTYIHSFGGPRD